MRWHSEYTTVLGRFWRHSSCAVFMHCLLRCLTAPLVRVVAQVPRQARVLDFGCGYGLIAGLVLAGTARATSVTGVDIDMRKIAVAQKVFNDDVRGTFICNAQVPAGRFDAVVASDVLCYLPYRDQSRMVAALGAAVERGGILVLKVVDPCHGLGSVWDRVQEYVALRVVRATKTAGGRRYFPRKPKYIRSCMERNGLAVEVIPCDRGYMHPHVLIIGRKCN